MLIKRLLQLLGTVLDSTNIMQQFRSDVSKFCTGYESKPLKLQKEIERLRQNMFSQIEVIRHLTASSSILFVFSSDKSDISYSHFLAVNIIYYVIIG